MFAGIERATLSADGMSEEEIRDETSAILVQQAYILQLQEQVLRTRSDDC